MRNRLLIYILGPEGAGKTTQAYLVKRYLEKRYRLPVVITEVRSNNLFMYLLIKFLIWCGRAEYYRYPDVYISRVDRLFIGRIINTWLILETAAFLTAHVLKVLLFRLMGYTVIVTRHVIDFLVDMYAIGLSSHKITRTHLIITRLLLRLFSAHSIIIYLDAGYSSLLARYRKRGSYTEPRGWIEFYRTLSKSLLSFATYIETYYIDTSSLDIKAVFNIVSNLITSQVK
ncbi:Thymidylate kinase family protein [Thermoproteus tenax Kra 1]|uniref:Thymidylate kinase family protein n=1 Tax=Thermoproteus tenax (strain ATCC 35583 / DSM 2078 / JCM 9277 / NBRC 100435 / Kra 1) TaxID=768679 RepID=G4RK88_THETK|nr:Thymidylate kinase family protein [Thermoproteus tenax Kra 1]